jgi:hypothetical protein
MIGSRSKQSESVSSDGVSGTGTVGDARGPGGSAVAAGRAAPAVVNHHRLAPVPRTAAAAGAVGHRAGRVTRRRAGARRTGLGLEGLGDEVGRISCWVPGSGTLDGATCKIGCSLVIRYSHTGQHRLCVLEF